MIHNSREQGHSLKPIMDVPVATNSTGNESVFTTPIDTEVQLAPSMLNIARAEAEYARRRIEALAANIEAFIACTDQPVMTVTRQGAVGSFNSAWCQAMGLTKSTDPEICMRSLSEEVQDAVFEMLSTTDGSFQQLAPVSIPLKGLIGLSEALIMPVYHLPEVLEGVAVLLR